MRPTARWPSLRATTSPLLAIQMSSCAIFEGDDRAFETCSGFPLRLVEANSSSSRSSSTYTSLWTLPLVRWASSRRALQGVRRRLLSVEPQILLAWQTPYRRDEDARQPPFIGLTQGKRHRLKRLAAQVLGIGHCDRPPLRNNALSLHQLPEQAGKARPSSQFGESNLTEFNSTVVTCAEFAA